MNNPYEQSRMMALQYVRNNPQVLQNNPKAQELYSILQSGDPQRGMEVASNLCQSYNTQPQEAFNMAGQRFGFNQQRTN